MTHGTLGLAFVYLVAAVAFVPLAKRLGLGSVLGYLLAGIVIGPAGFDLVGDEGHAVMHFAEFGVVMMLFLVGLELRPALLWGLRRSILGLGSLQVLGTAAVVALASMALSVPWKAAIAIGLTLTMSSTAIVLQSLAEKGSLRTEGGQAAFSVLLFQDIAVIPILAVFPLLAASGGQQAPHGARPAWVSALLIVLAVAAVVGLGRYLVGPLFRLLAKARLREIFTAAALLLVIAIALLMQAVGLSPALGTFLAGVVLAESEYRHELESDIEPFKGLLLGVFFISVGAQIDFGHVASEPLAMAGLVLGTMSLKALVLYVVALGFGLGRTARWLFALALPQVGEFAFVLISFGTQSRVFGAEIATPLVAAVALSMALTPPLFLALERYVLPRLSQRTEQRAHDTIEHEENPVVIAGYGRFGQIVGRVLRANGFDTTVLDLNPSTVDVLRRVGVKVYYGDASRPELLYSAGCERARLFVLAVDDPDQAAEIAQTVQRHFPDLRILARARDRAQYFRLRRLGIEVVQRETFGSAFELGIQALVHLGVGSDNAQRLAERWRRHESRGLTELEKFWGVDDEAYFATAKRLLEEAESWTRDATKQRAQDPGWEDASARDAPTRTGRAAAQTEEEESTRRD